MALMDLRGWSGPAAAAALGIGAGWEAAVLASGGMHYWLAFSDAGGAGLLVAGAVIVLMRKRRTRPDILSAPDTLSSLPIPSYLRSSDELGSLSAVSPALVSLLGYAPEQWAADARLWLKALHRDDRERVLAEWTHHVRGGDHFAAEYRLLTEDGDVVWVRDEAVPFEDERGHRRQRGVLIDITEQKRVEEELEHQMLHDSLTDLPNRTLLIDRLQQAIITARRDRKPLALLLMDLDRFKDINDTFGHHYGDLVLRQVVTHLRFVLRESDTVARLGGDEFAVVLPGDDARGAILTVEKVIHVLRQPYSAEGHLLDVGASIGIALFPDHGNDASTLLQRADVAMYAAKRTDAGYALYEPRHDPYSPTRLSLVRELRDAIEHDRLVLHYQPKAHIHDGTAHHLEALVRWNHPRLGLIPPEEFITLAEHAGLMKPLSLWVLNAALRQCHVWREGGNDVSIAVNLSARSLHDPELVASIRRLLDRWKIPADRLEVEITEGALMIDPGRAMETLTELHGMGICISIDDFGTGYSSLSYLTRLPADQIKIDKSFVLNMARNDDSAFIVRSVIDLGHNLSLRVVAEGVENQETWDLLADMGCDVAQGYHLSRPLPAAEMSHWLADSDRHVRSAS